MKDPTKTEAGLRFLLACVYSYKMLGQLCTDPSENRVVAWAPGEIKTIVTDAYTIADQLLKQGGGPALFEEDE